MDTSYNHFELTYTCSKQLYGKTAQATLRMHNCYQKLV